MKLFLSTKSKITKDENDKNVPHLEITEHFNIVANDFWQDSRILFTFIPNESFVLLLDI